MSGFLQVADPLIETRNGRLSLGDLIAGGIRCGICLANEDVSRQENARDNCYCANSSAYTEVAHVGGSPLRRVLCFLDRGGY